jgi:apolipoprotein N-acyltransferase
LAAALAAHPAQRAWLGLAPGDVTLAVRFALTALASLGFAIAQAGAGRHALGNWLGALSPALLFVPGFPALLAPFGLIPFYVAALGAHSDREALVLGACAAVCFMIGAAGWIFHYFDRPLVPELIALAILSALWAPLCWVTRRLVRRSPLWVPAAAALFPLGEIVRGEWMNPPLPGLLLAHAVADTALVRLAPWVGEAGIGFVVALLGLASAAWLATRAPRVSAMRRLGPFVLLLAALAALQPGDKRAPANVQPMRVCSIQDPLRGSGPGAFGGAGDAAVFALAAHAEELGCRLAVFPEYSLRLVPQQIVPAEWGAERQEDGMVVIGGASIRYDERGQHSLRNVVCRIHLGPGRQINCAGAYDKLIFAPFGEIGLFQDVPLLAKLGARLSQQATGAKFTRLTSLQPVGLLPIGGGRRAGVAICWEILVPQVFERRGAAPGSVALLAVVSDLGGFGGSRAAIEQFRRAASVHAVSLGAPLLLASTHDPFLVSASGRVAVPVYRDSFVTAWEIAL